MKPQTLIARSSCPKTIATRLRTVCASGLLPLLLLLALPAAVQAQFNYTATNGTVTITTYTGPGGSVTIPDRIPDTTNGLPVTSIGDNAFWDCTGLGSVTIPNGVTGIGGDAFAGTGLTSVTIPDSLTSIGDGAFSGCTSLTGVTIPNGVSSIGYQAFAGCLSLAAITVDAPNLFYSSEDGVLFNKSQTTLIAFPAGRAGTYTIPNSVTRIGDYAFYGCGSLTNVTIPDSVTSVGDDAFCACASLTSVTIGGATSMGGQAFMSCTKLAGVYFQGNAPGVGSSVFSGDSNATVYHLPGTTGWGPTFAGLPAFLWDPLSQAGYTTTNGTVTITRYTGPGGAVTIPGTITGLPVTSIGDYTFDGCTSLTSVTIDSGVTSIGDSAFYGCTNLTGVYFKGNAPSLGAYVFDGDYHAAVYRLPWTTEWGPTFGGRPTVLWNPLSGTYNGLFADDTGSLSPQNRGCFTILSTLKGKGAFSGSLRMGGTRYPLSGQFDSAGAASSTIARRDMSALTVTLQLDLTNGTDRVTGSVSDGTWTAMLAGDRAIYDGKTTLAPEAGSYTLILAGAYGSTNEPTGDSYGTLTVGKNGAISFRGMLADGTKVTQSAPVSKYGQWPLYASLHGGQGVLWGWLAFTNASELGGSVAWVKLPVKTQYYAAGFSLAAEALGARYFPPGRGTNVLGLTTSTDLTLTLEGDGLVAGITNGITLGANNHFTPVSGPKLSLTFTPSTGGFRGSVVNPATSKRVSFSGVLLQGQGFGSGFFLGTSECGEVRLEP
jgi:hypothetical protein